jgi:hypothetical protein
MSRMFVYGCSYSFPILEYKKYPHRMYPGGTWMELLSRKLGLELQIRSIPGSAFRDISSAILRTEHEWKEGDVVVINPSKFSRVKYCELNIELRKKLHEFDTSVFDDRVDIGYLSNVNRLDWSFLISNLHKRGVRVFTWVFDSIFLRFDKEVSSLFEDRWGVGHHIKVTTDFNYSLDETGHIVAEEDIEPYRVYCRNLQYIRVNNLLIDPVKPYSCFYDWLQADNSMINDKNYHFSEYGHEMLSNHFFNHLVNHI